MARAGRDEWWESRLAAGGGASRVLELSASSMGALLLLGAINSLGEAALVGGGTLGTGLATLWRVCFGAALVAYLGALVSLTQRRDGE